MHLPRPSLGTTLWCGLSLALALPAAMLAPVPLSAATSTWPPLAQSLVLHPDAGLHQAAWAWWSTAWLHGSALHLDRNLIACLLIALLGASCRLQPGAALAWMLAWPLTQLGLLAQQPALHTYIGLSGVLHAGVAIVAMAQITAPGRRADKWLGWVLLIGLIGKILMENPWHNALIHPPGSDITVAPWAHLSGTVAGLALSMFGSCFQAMAHLQQADT